jgi:Zn-dependent protease
MIKSSYQLCKLFGIPIKLDISLIILLFLFIRGYDNPVYGLAAGILLLVSITLHELGHSLTSIAFGCRVHDITLMIIGGRATLESMPRKYWQEFLVAIAGPAVSLALGLTGIFAPFYFHRAGLATPQMANFLMESVGFLNLALFGFNLLPAFPMDGGRILRSALQIRMSKLRATWVASRIGRVLAVIMIVCALCNILGINLPKPPVQGVAGELIWHFLSGGTFIKFLIGLMIYSAADREYRMVMMEEGAARKNPFAGFPFFGSSTRTPPPDDGQAVVSPPPYSRGGGTRVDVRKAD